jgi:uncharacterized protein
MNGTAMTFHEGELAVQARAGFGDQAAKVGSGIRDYIMPAAAKFLSERAFAVVSAADAAGMMWAAPLAGAPGFITVPEPRVVTVNALPAIGDPLAEALAGRTSVGMIAIEFASRRRFRVNGIAERRGDSIVLAVGQAYGNCPQYIQIRERDAQAVHSAPSAALESTQLSRRHREWIARADTFFIATSHPGAGADASHRGGLPGFVVVESPHRVTFPDYPGNTMFNTLGNLEVNPHAGLLFIDFATGSTLQASGRAQVIWDHERVAKFAGAERIVEVTIDRVVEIAGAIPWRWKLVAYSPSFS